MERRAIQRKVVRDLGVKNRNIAWFGTRGMKWKDFPTKIQHIILHNPSPKVIFIHLGSNDMGEANNSCNLERFIKKELMNLHTLFPNAKIIFSSLLPRLIWSRTIIPPVKIDKKRRHCNDRIRRFMGVVNGQFLANEEISADTPGLYFSNGVHLSDIGSDILILNFKDALERLQ